MQMDLKNNHHYIYKDYLNGWALNGIKNGVFYLTKKRNIAKDSAAGLLVEKNFYNFSPILDEDLFLFDKFISTFGEQHRESSRKMVADFYDLSTAHRLVSQLKKTPESNNLIQAIERNTLEDLHCSIENAARPILKRLWAGDFTAVNSDENCAKFAYFLGCQALRNKGPKLDTFKRFSALQAKDEAALTKLNSFWYRYWNIIMALLSQNMGANIFGNIRKGKFEFLTNGTSLPFITSDRPINNIHPAETKKDDVPESMDLYYPLSPNIAFHLPESFSGCRVVRDVETSEVDTLNIEVAKASFGTIISTTKETIERYKKIVPMRS